MSRRTRARSRSRGSLIAGSRDSDDEVDQDETLRFDGIPQMKLLYVRASPFVRKVMVLLAEAGRTGDVELVAGFGSPTAPHPAVVAANPVGKIPCLILDDGTTLYDSRVITRYLDERHGLGLYPRDERVWATLTLEAHADGILDAAVLCVYESRCRDEAIRSPAWLAGQHAKITRALDALEARWLGHLDGPLDIGQIAVGCALEYLDFRLEIGGWPPWREGRTPLAAWAEAFGERPSMRTTRPAD